MISNSPMHNNLPLRWHQEHPGPNLIQVLTILLVVLGGGFSVASYSNWVESKILPSKPIPAFIAEITSPQTCENR